MSAQEFLNSSTGAKENRGHLLRANIPGRQDKCPDTVINQRAQFTGMVANLFVLCENNPFVFADGRQPFFIGCIRAKWSS